MSNSHANNAHNTGRNRTPAAASARRAGEPASSDTSSYVYQSATARINAPSTRFDFPAYADIVDLSPYRNEDLPLLAKAPWFHPYAVKDDALLNHYVVAGELPGEIPIFAVRTFDWVYRFAVPDNLLLYRSPAERKDPSLARQAYVKLLFQRMGRTIGRELVPEPTQNEFILDTWMFRTEGESSYGANLMAFNADRYRGSPTVSQDCLLWERPVLRAEFRYLRKRDNTVFWDMLRWERRARSRHGYLLAYQMIEVDRIRRNRLHNRYVSIPQHWSACEVPEGFLAELPPVLTYLGSVMMQDSVSGLWTLFYTEWIVKIAVFLLWDVYDSHRLWFLPRQVRDYAKELDLSFPLGSRKNNAEFRYLISIIESVNWDDVPLEQSRRSGTNRRNFWPGRVGSSGDFVWFDPWTKELVSRDRAAELRRNRRERPPTQPTGFRYEPAPVEGMGALAIDDREGEVDESMYDLESDTDSEREAPVRREVSVPARPAQVAAGPAANVGEVAASSEPSSATKRSGDPVEELRRMALEAGLLSEADVSAGQNLGRDNLVNAIKRKLSGAATTASNAASSAPGRIQVPHSVPPPAVSDASSALETQRGAASSTGQARTGSSHPAENADKDGGDKQISAMDTDGAVNAPQK